MLCGPINIRGLLLFLQTSTVSGELSTSTMTYTPRSEDHGKTLHCRATNPEMHRGVLEDQWKLDVQCKLFFVTIQRCVLYLWNCVFAFRVGSKTSISFCKTLEKTLF